MKNELDIRLKADRFFVKHLCEITGKSASALAVGANMAATTLNRFVSRKAKLSSTLKDSTVEKIAKRWGLNYLELAAYRKEIEEALREGRGVPDMDKIRLKPSGYRSGAKLSGLKDPTLGQFAASARDALMDQIMGATYEVWFNSGYRENVEFERLPDLVRLLYSRAKAEPKTPTIRDIGKRAADMLAVVAMESKARKQ